jgi:hypothetical protein
MQAKIHAQNLGVWRAMKRTSKWVSEPLCYSDADSTCYVPAWSCPNRQLVPTGTHEGGFIKYMQERGAGGNPLNRNVMRNDEVLKRWVQGLIIAAKQALHLANVGLVIIRGTEPASSRDDHPQKRAKINTNPMDLVCLTNLDCLVLGHPTFPIQSTAIPKP